jgi:hypothetical protein
MIENQRIREIILENEKDHYNEKDHDTKDNDNDK